VLGLACRGQVVLVGRGAHCILPRPSTLAVRVVAPERDRVAYMAQWLRLTEPEARERVEAQDRRRADFLLAHFGRRPDDLYQYDLVLNSSTLGEEVCAELIAHAVRARAAQAGAGRP
jgi:cytidylate kinase